MNNCSTKRIHEINYGLEKPEVKEVEAEDVIKIAEDFISAVEKII